MMRRGPTREQIARLDAAQASGKGLMGLLNSVLDDSKLEQSQTADEIVDFDLAEALGDISLLMAPMAGEKGLRLVTTLPDIPLPPLRGDLGKLRPILVNLVSTTLKFTDRAEVRIDVAVDSSVESDPLVLRFTVSDTGSGIAEDALERIFDAFQQEGIHLAASLLARGGATVTCGEACALPAPLTVLVVKDHPVNQEVAAAFLTGMGHRAVIAETGEAAPERVAAGGFNAVLMT